MGGHADFFPTALGAGKAIGVSTVISVVGGLIGVAVLTLAAPIILGPLMDMSYRRAVMASDGFADFLLSLFIHPLTCILTLAVIFMLVSQTRVWVRMKEKLFRR